MSAPDDEGPLTRWSRRKAAATAERQDISTPEELELAATDATLPVEIEVDEQSAVDGDEPAPLELPPIEELDANSDYTQFMADGVPEALTRAALRKLWLSDPILANLDGLNDYDEDFNLIDKLISAADTNYKVGKGMVAPEEDEELEEGADVAVVADETKTDGQDAPDDDGEEPLESTAATHVEDDPDVGEDDILDG